MKKVRSVSATVLALAVAALAGAGSAQAFQRPDASPREQAKTVEGQQAVTDRLIVKYRDAVNLSAPRREALMSAQVAGNRVGVRLSHHRRTATGAHVLRLDKPLPVAQVQSIVQDLRGGDANVEYAEPDWILQPMMTPSDSLYAQQWSLFDPVGGINAPKAWDKSTGSGVVVAVIDTGVRPHADLAANLLPGYDFIADTKISNDLDGRDRDAQDPGDAVTAGFCASGSTATSSSWHGTHVAGTIAAVTNNGAGVAAVAPGAKVVPVRVLGRCGGYMSDIADGLLWAAGGSVSGAPSNPYPARVLNLSLGGAGQCGTTLQNSIHTARLRGAVVVVAAGNSNTDAAGSMPANCNGVITVAATGRTGGRASYSNFGAVVDLAAPGGDSGSGILSTLNAGTSAPGADSYAYYMGTSMATPHVSGIAALMLQRNPALSADEVEARLKSSARAFPSMCGQCGTGIVDANAAVDMAGETSQSAPVTAPIHAKEIEVNNTRSSAQSLQTASAGVDGSIHSTGDTDFFKIVVPGNGKTAVSLTPNPQSNYDLYVYNQTGRLIAVSQKGTGQVERITLSNSSTQETGAYLRVVYVSGLTEANLGTYRVDLAH